MAQVAISALPAASSVGASDIFVINQAGITKQATASMITLESGTKVLFQQSAAPTGWTKDTTHDNKALRIVSGAVSSGGATGFTSVFGAAKTTGSTTLTTDHLPASGLSIPSLTVAINSIANGDGSQLSGTSTSSNQANEGSGGDSPSSITNGSTGTGTTGNMGTGGGHTHTESLDLQYVDVIVATKD